MGINLTLCMGQDSPLCVADALIEYEIGRATNSLDLALRRENLRQIGKALLEYVDSCERIEQTDCAWGKSDENH